MKKIIYSLLLVSGLINTAMAVEGNIEAAAKAHKRLLPIFNALFWVTNPVPIKYAVNRAGFDAGKNRLPLCDPDQAFTSKFDEVMDRYDVDLPID